MKRHFNLGKTSQLVWAASALLTLTFVAPANAGAPQCSTWNGQGYCQYVGRVSSAYVNDGNQIILYFDTPMDPGAPASVGISGVSVYSAATYRMTDNMDFGKALYASLLAAQSRGATVEVQMWGVYAGYLKIDRIWVHE
jgi:hypothetical protein